MERDTSQVRRVARTLAERRLWLYGVGLAIVTAPRAFASLDVATPAVVGTAAFVLGLGLMVVTYVSELWVGRSPDADAEQRTEDAAAVSESEPAYGPRERAVLAVAVLGVAVGVYVAVTVNRIAGILFVGGSLFFGQYAFRRGGEGATDR